jgi:hypothetical protein
MQERLQAFEKEVRAKEAEMNKQLAALQVSGHWRHH